MHNRGKILIDQFFTNADYYKNEEFQKLMREWNTIKIYPDEILNEQVKENTLSDFYEKAKEWLMHNYDEDEWKKDLE